MSGNKHPIDWQAVLTITGNRPELAREMVNLFIAELPKLQKNINEAYKKHDIPALYDHVHKLHGSSCYCGALYVQGIASQLEEIFKKKLNTPIDDLIQQLNTEIKNILTSHVNAP